MGGTEGEQDREKKIILLRLNLKRTKAWEKDAFFFLGIRALDLQASRKQFLVPWSTPNVAPPTRIWVWGLPLAWSLHVWFQSVKQEAEKDFA